MGLLSAFLLLLPLLVLIPTSLLIYRLLVILNPRRNKPLRHGRRNPHEPTHLLIVLGSGGHTAEMLGLLDRAVNDPDPNRRLDWKDFAHRTWVVGSGDSISAERAKEFEEMATGLGTQETLMKGKVKGATDLGPGTYEIVTVPRAREIHQSVWTAPLSCLQCMQSCWTLLTKDTDKRKKDFPDLILCNGPATATVLVFTSVVLRLFDVKQASTKNKMRTVYVESWARVKRLSLSGTLLSKVVDRFLVQWPQLERKYRGRVEYAGVLVN